MGSVGQYRVQQDTSDTGVEVNREQCSRSDACDFVYIYFYFCFTISCFIDGRPAAAARARPPH